MTSLHSLLEDYRETLRMLAPYGKEYNFKVEDIVATDGGRFVCHIKLRDGRKLLFVRDTPTGQWECLGDIKHLRMKESFDFLMPGNTSLRTLLEGKKSTKSKYSTYQKNKIPLTDEERAECFKQDAVWHYGFSIDPNTGQRVKKVCAVWKSKDPKTGEVTYITNTHRAWNSAPTLKGAISRYHNFIKGTA